MIDKDRILTRLRAGHDVSPIDYQLPGVVDGGKPILRVAARIHDLIEDGHVITKVGKRNRCAVYRLTRDAETRHAEARDVPVVEGDHGQLRIGEAA